ncbi:hypothetical protein AA309_19655 [Microvirga vignae]|uniref:Uncharacterized protein n=1 Tax=Microvirga vignae TaxID=1225564 RepID=A0A0H1R8P9_9HYPH|nr:hypothetical protein AA309_19655 [Microvirga vignae]
MFLIATVYTVHTDHVLPHFPFNAALTIGVSLSMNASVTQEWVPDGHGEGWRLLRPSLHRACFQ